MRVFYLVDENTTLSEKIDNDTVVINLNTGCYYNFNPTASYIWELINAGFDKGSILEIFESDFSLDAEASNIEVSEIINFLLSKELIKEAARNDNPTKKPRENIPYTKPAIEEFDDMQEMLLLDPIHEVTEKGWPYKKDEE